MHPHMRSIPAIAILLILTSCSGPRLKFAITNQLDTEIRNVEIRLPDTTLFYASVKSKTLTPWVKVSRAYSYAYIKFVNQHDSEIVFIPVDYVGEKLYKNGYMQYIVYYPDSSKQGIGTAFSRVPFMSSRIPEEKE
jgi:hypothetical protein